jgi:AraC family transcriptional regulator of adaptative response/methylated-DNA-[protein]-cysteine methyltransferase
MNLSQQADDYRRIERAIDYIEPNFKHQPTLDQMARSVHLSKFHFNKVFKRWAGISYQDIAVGLGKPNAVRAVASAVTVNPVAYLILCHRVIA